MIVVVFRNAQQPAMLRVTEMKQPMNTKVVKLQVVAQKQKNSQSFKLLKACKGK